MGTYIKVAQKEDIQENAGKSVQAEGKTIALFRAGDDYYALDNECTHVGGPLCEGMISGTEVTCPWHGARFELATGEVVAGPARANVSSYAVRVQGNDIEIEV